MNDNSAPSPEKGESRSKDELWIKGAVQQHLDREVDAIDFNVSSKLAAARHRAMEQHKSGNTGLATDWLHWPALAGGSAMLVLALVVGNQFYPPTSDTLPANTVTAENTPVAPGDLIEDLPLLSATDDIEFYQSIEFLEWMESNSG